MFFGAYPLTLSLDTKAFQAARLEPELQNIAFAVLRRLCGKTGYLPDSYLLSEKFDLSEMPRAFGGFADIRAGMFKGKDVAIKTLRVSEVDDKTTIRKVWEPSYNFSTGLAYTRRSASAKRLPYGRTCLTPTFSVSLASLIH